MLELQQVRETFSVRNRKIMARNFAVSAVWRNRRVLDACATPIKMWLRNICGAENTNTRRWKAEIWFDFVLCGCFGSFGLFILAFSQFGIYRCTKRFYLNNLPMQCSFCVTWHCTQVHIRTRGYVYLPHYFITVWV